jgi:hypothetical protein
MNRTITTTPHDAKRVVAELLQTKPPVLVEVRFPNSATSPDWHLCEDEEQFEQILDRLGSGVEVHISSVWDLTNLKDAVVLTK